MRVRLVAVVAVALLAAACGTPKTQAAPADKVERAATDQIAQAYATNQPIPAASWSQIRQNLIEIETAQIKGSTTWSYFFSPGRADGAPVFACSSVGYPIPATYQLTNPEKTISGTGGGQGGYGLVTLPQMEPTGVFTGSTDGTHVICLTDEGKTYDVYWEGPVTTVTVELRWDASKEMLEVTGRTSPDAATFTRGK